MADAHASKRPLPTPPTASRLHPGRRYRSHPHSQRWHPALVPPPQMCPAAWLPSRRTRVPSAQGMTWTQQSSIRGCSVWRNARQPHCRPAAPAKALARHSRLTLPHLIPAGYQQQGGVCPELQRSDAVLGRVGQRRAQTRGRRRRHFATAAACRSAAWDRYDAPDGLLLVCWCVISCPRARESCERSRWAPATCGEGAARCDAYC